MTLTYALLFWVLFNITFFLLAIFIYKSEQDTVGVSILGYLFTVTGVSTIITGLILLL